MQVVALQWKWLFIYPDQKIASLNYFQIPENTPINFEITADAPMNSFWIPRLGGQIYAMPGMQTKLHLIADHTGTYHGSSANLSGAGFADMRFAVDSVSEEQFDNWIKNTQSSGMTLDTESYKELAAPSEKNTPTTYQLKDDQLFDQIVMQYMQSQKE